MMHLRIFAMAFLIACASLSAQPNPHQKPIVLKAAHIFDGKNFSSPGVVVVTDGKIVAAGASASIPADATVMDLGDSTLSPGFIDAHVHLTLEYTNDFRTSILTRIQMPLAEQALNASVNARV